MELGNYQRQLRRDEEAARSFRVASTVFEQLPHRTAADLYNLAGAAPFAQRSSGRAT